LPGVGRVSFHDGQRQNADGSRDLYGPVAARPGAAQVQLEKMR
jgi:hypothetical protein